MLEKHNLNIYYIYCYCTPVVVMYLFRPWDVCFLSLVCTWTSVLKLVLWQAYRNIYEPFFKWWLYLVFGDTSAIILCLLIYVHVWNCTGMWGCMYSRVCNSIANLVIKNKRTKTLEQWLLHLQNRVKYFAKAEIGNIIYIVFCVLVFTFNIIKWKF